MKHFLLISILLLLCLLSLSAMPQSKPPAWEYKVEYKCTEKRANALGAEGWELVSMHESGTGLSALEVCGLKRAKN